MHQCFVKRNIKKEWLHELCTETGIGLTINILLLHFHTVSVDLSMYTHLKDY